MSDPGILVLDVGLSAVKVQFFSLEGEDLARAQHAITTRSPHPGWFVQDPEEWWQGAVNACRHLWAAIGTRAVAGIGITGHMHAPVLVDSTGKAVVECPVLWDRRPEAEWADLGSSFDVRAYHARTGGRISPQAVPAKLRWMALHAPEALKRASVLVAPKDFLRLRLTREALTDPTDGAGLLLLDIHHGTWADEFARAAGIAPALLPSIKPSAAVAGVVTREAAHALGVAAGTPVVTGAGDDVEALGIGAIHPGDVYEHLGSTGTLGAVTDRLILDPQARVETVPHPYQGRWIVGGSTNAAGAGLDFVRRLLGDRGDGEATAPRPTTPIDRWPLFLPYLSGERAPLWDDSLRGAFVGLELTTDRQDVLASVLEGIAFSLRDISEVLREMGLQQRRVYASGGASIPGWARLRASVYGLPIVTRRDGDATGRGAFLLAAVGLGVFKTLDEALSATSVEGDVSPPDADAAAHEIRYRAFRTLVDALVPWFRARVHSNTEGGERAGHLSPPE